MIWDQLPASSGGLAIKLAEHQKYGNWSWIKESDGSFGIAYEMRVDSEVTFLSKTRYFHLKKKYFEGIGHMLTITCSDKGFLETFQVFCKDLMVSTELSESTANSISIIENKIFIWLRLFKLLRGMSRQKAIGLFGELAFLDKWLSMGRDVSGWLGSSDAPQDFVCNSSKLAIEVKSISNDSNSVKISSLHQLDFDGDLYLAVVRFSESNNMHSVFTLSDYIKKIKISLNTIDSEIFDKKIIEYGYHEDDDVSQISFCIDSINYYQVTNYFPKISRAMLPNEVSDCTYEINLAQCKNYMIPGETFLEKIYK